VLVLRAVPAELVEVAERLVERQAVPLEERLVARLVALVAVENSATS